MGELSDMILDGTLCDSCGGVVYEGDPKKASPQELSPGHPRTCKDCEEFKKLVKENHDT